MSDDLFNESEHPPKLTAKKRARHFNRDNARHLLERHGIAYWSHNEGVHLMVAGNYQLIDFWPGTGRWTSRNKEVSGFGIQGLLEMIDSGQI
ncbi:hypothetical protein LH51_01070 [Nitrincola sp. A-D6]|uniref:hypothetical protein n=1 Tax=Nitrincola sp. A-D6 TaxID=1545442 RepID=UPI00051FAD0C|nr:hypothetical protein [Nitrincola sp. A-D6]KGK43259.1 hypothetical protein LH51_01070 [Nitrincola sp. A-D6]